MIDEEQQYLTDLAHRRATAIVSENRELLEALAFTLLENEALERADIDRIVASHRSSNGKPADLGAAAGGEPRIAASERLEPEPPPN